MSAQNSPEFKVVSRSKLAKVRARQAVNASRQKALAKANDNSSSKTHIIIASLIIVVLLCGAAIWLVPPINSAVFGGSTGDTTLQDGGKPSDAPGNAADANPPVTDLPSVQSPGTGKSSQDGATDGEAADADSSTSADSSNQNSKSTLSTDVTATILKYYGVSNYSDIPMDGTNELLNKITAVSESAQGNIQIRLSVTYASTTRNTLKTATAKIVEICKNSLPNLLTITVMTSDNHYIETARSQ